MGGEANIFQIKHNVLPTKPLPVGSVATRSVYSDEVCFDRHSQASIRTLPLAVLACSRSYLGGTDTRARLPAEQPPAGTGLKFGVGFDSPLSATARARPVAGFSGDVASTAISCISMSRFYQQSWLLSLD